MRLTTAGLRRLLINPAAFVASARAVAFGATPAKPFGNPQRIWMEAAIRKYYESERQVDELWKTLNLKASKSQHKKRDSLAAGAIPLLKTFLEWDQARSTDVPADYFPPARNVTFGQHVLAVKRDLIFLEVDGYRVRQLWTDHQLDAMHPDAALMAAVVMTSVDFDLGPHSVKGVDVWGLRRRRQRTWQRAELQPLVSSVVARLDAAESAIQAP